MRRALLVTAFAWLFAATAACRPGPEGHARRARPRAPTFGERVSPARVRFVFEGRVSVRDASAPRFDWPASGFRFAFRGTGVSLRFEDVLFADEVRDTDYLAVYVDGNAPITVSLREGTFDYPIVRGLPSRVHEVRVLKRSESEAGSVRLRGLYFEGRGVPVDPPARRPRTLLAIGDSITAGYGIDGPDASCHYSSGTSNATRSYAFLAARDLDMEYQAVAWSGRGLYRNFDPKAEELVPILYQRFFATEPDSRFDPRAYTVDAIVVNLGTNDLSQPAPDRGRFLAAYRAFVARLRADYPNAPIVLVVGPMLADDYPPRSNALRKARTWTASVVASRRARGDQHVSMLEIPGASPDEGYGCDFHPSLRTHQRMAALLEERLREVMP